MVPFWQVEAHLKSLNEFSLLLLSQQQILPGQQL